MTVATETLTLEEVETRHIAAVLAKHGGRKPVAAVELGISLKTLYNKINTRRELEPWRPGYQSAEPVAVPFALRLAEAPLDTEVADDN